MKRKRVIIYISFVAIGFIAWLALSIFISYDGSEESKKSNRDRDKFSSIEEFIVNTYAEDIEASYKDLSSKLTSDDSIEKVLMRVYELRYCPKLFEIYERATVGADQRTNKFLKGFIDDDFKEKMGFVLNTYKDSTNKLYSFSQNELFAYTTNTIQSKIIDNPVSGDPENKKPIPVDPAYFQFQALSSYMGTNLLPLLPFFQSQLCASSNYVPAVVCLKNMEGQGRLALIRGLTNETPVVLRLILLEGMMDIKPDKTYPEIEEIYKESERYLLPLTEHKDDVVRNAAINCLRYYINDTDKVFSILRKHISSDPDDGIKAFSIFNLVGMYKNHPESVSEEQKKRDIDMIEELEKKSKNKDVHKTTQMFLRSIESQNQKKTIRSDQTVKE